MPNLPLHLDIPRFTHDPKNVESWIDTFHKTLQRQWTMMVQAYNALMKIDTAANMPSTPYLDEIQFYESDTGRSYLAVSGNWITLTGWTGNTATYTVSATMEPTHATALVDATSSAVTVTVNNGSSYKHRVRCVKKIDSTANSVYVLPSSGTIDGAVSRNLSVQYQTILFTSDGTNLYLVSTT